ncbi:flagellar biosynthesis protein FlhB [bacterium]|nr:flagellar biosynthesis protein FlhB [bacterium]
MAEMEEGGQEKTEEPTDKRLEEFREEGQVAKSQEVGALIGITASFLILSMQSKSMGHLFHKSITTAFAYDASVSWGSHILYWIQLTVLPIMHLVAIFMISILLLTVAASFFQTGFLFSTKSLAPKFDSVNPFEGIKRLFSPNSLIQLLKSLAKVSVIGWIVYMQVKGHLKELLMLANMPIQESADWCLKMVAGIVLKISIFMAGLAGLDYLYNWYKLHEKMKMTRQELKDEMKQNQLPESVRGKVRQVANERAKRALKEDVPKADVIITNPTHYAIAIRYRRFIDRAPTVVAKGKNYLAKTIREIGDENNIPLYEYPELARALYSKVKVGSPIPEDLYEGVAKVLAYVYRVYKKRSEARA